MIQYYAFMGLLCVTLLLWAIIAIRDDSPVEDEDTQEADKESVAEDKPDAAAQAETGAGEDAK